MENVMKVINGVLLALLVCFTRFADVEAMSVILENQMKEPIYVDSIKTNGSLVTNSAAILGSCLEQKEKKPIRIEVYSPSCSFEGNSIEISVYDKVSGEYKPFHIMWNRVSLSDDHTDDVLSYIVTRQSDGRSSFVYTVWDAEESVISRLKTTARQQIDTVRTSQQKVSYGVIARSLGLPLDTVEELHSDK